MVRSRDEWKNWGLLLVLALIWGSSFILMKRGLFHAGRPVLSPLQLATARLTIAWLALLPLLFVHAPLFRKHWLPLLGTGVLGNGIPAFLFAYAQTRIDSALAGMLNSLTPLSTLLIGVLFFGHRLRVAHVIGILAGLAGAVGLIVWQRTDEGLPSWNLYAVLPLLGTICYGCSANIVKRHLYTLPAAATACLALTFLGPWTLVGVRVTDLPTTLETDPDAWRALGYVALLAVLSSALSLVLWNVLLMRTTAVWASSVTYLMPVVAIGWGLLDGEVLSGPQVAMILLILLAVWLVGRAERMSDI
ncbi:MAG: DMT family transporter [Bacteroidetes bacterium]|nr:DMT family transporter [Bacteroidota bacterium]MBX7129067.1 DMT family transporter [Flavobacteriales bacterium]MCC6655368.1 DMT family transporter [Flavobacteriales bacterium]HMU15505.1 DMT family transporter [Flavobacteriales bacterium]HMW96290.1 DMT family transporter [Flavobacteriales bacterium]